MTLFDTGRLCVKTAGRESGKLCVVLDKAEKDFVLITGPRVLSGVRKRKCNVEHLEPLQSKIKIKPSDSDMDILDAIKKEDSILQKFDLKVPTAEDIKKWEAQRAERIVKKAEAEKAKKAAPPTPKKEEKKEPPKTETKKEEPKPVVSEKTKEEKPKEAKTKKESKPKIEK